ncbi:glycosyltransferase [Paracoccus aurantiacus]|uniref:Glycosyltransferase n=1 Tax=Paracoccus aurantiacus TaxID=2599412 RepID=A0A5C6S7I0_9RHOB|nr:glycosyltransferase [Paracoccus aurantiacus]TXB69604.1 glycosyltransferase [Paracoccus aurantiacus]
MLPKVLQSVFNRYTARHGSLSKPGFALRDRRGMIFGYVEAITVNDGRLRVEGWTVGGPVGLSNTENSVSGEPALQRNDVSSQFVGAENMLPGFRLDLPLSQSNTVFWVEHDGQSFVYPMPAIEHRDLTKMRLSQVLPFARDSLKVVAPGLHYLRHRDTHSAMRIKDALGLNTVTRSGELNADAFAPDSAPIGPLPDLPGGRITIVVPVYNGFDLLPKVLARVIKHTDLPFHLLLVEDRSSDDRVRPWLRSWHEGLTPEMRGQVTLIENDENLGFIRSVNRAFAEAIPAGAHVVLLNADAFVPEGWASKLMRPMLEESRVATVTPMSNDAEIFNAPVICERVDLQPGQVDLINSRIATLPGTGERVDVPTGVGFCMAMNIDYLRALPELDTVFGKGYGEEVDWCQRAALRGGRNLGFGGLFVEHRGGVSFGSEEKQRLMRSNGMMISRRYPRFDADVQDFIGTDPLLTSRLAMGIALAASAPGADVLIYLVHSMGGGAEHYVERRAADDVADGNVAIMLRVGGMSRWQIELVTPGGVTLGQTNDTDLIERLLSIPAQKTVVYSCGVGDRSPLEIPDVLGRIADGPNDRVEVLFHDFFPLSPSYTLLDSDGIFRGVPSAQENTDPAHEWRATSAGTVTLSDWREGWGRLMARADVLRVFSQDSRERVEAAYPEQSSKIEITPHKLLHDVPAVTRPANSANAPVIGVLGNIGHQKGAAVLRDMSSLLSRHGQAKLVVVGNVDPSYPLAQPARIHGNYQVADIPGLVARYGIDRWLIPSIWPETFSYATHEALATGLPVWSFDLGAQGDAVEKVARERGQGGIIPLPTNQDEISAALDIILSDAPSA